MNLEKLAKLEPRSKHEAVILLSDHILSTLKRKGNDYSNDNISLYGELGIAVRLGDKVLRLKSLVVDQRTAQNESVNDTYLDITGYGIIGLLYKFGWWDLPWEEK